MTDNKNLRTILELFHMARRHAQVLTRLKASVRQYTENLNEIGTAICVYAPWRVDQYLLRTECKYIKISGYKDVETLYSIQSVQFILPNALDMKPSFLYVIVPVIKISYDCGCTECDHKNAVSIASGKECQPYKLAYPTDIERIAKTLPRIRNKKS